MNEVKVYPFMGLTGEDIKYDGLDPQGFGLKAEFEGKELVFKGVLSDEDLNDLIRHCHMSPIGHLWDVYSNGTKMW